MLTPPWVFTDELSGAFGGPGQLMGGLLTGRNKNIVLYCCCTFRLPLPFGL